MGARGRCLKKKTFVYKCRIGLFNFNRLPGLYVVYQKKRLTPTFIVYFSSHRKLRMPVTSYDRYLSRSTCDKLRGVLLKPNQTDGMKGRC